MLNENLIIDLKRFGLNGYESRAYLALTLNGPLIASSLAEKSGIPQSKIYEIVKILKKRCLLETWNSNPQKYKAVEPSKALRKIIIERKNNIQELEERSKVILEKIKPLKSNGYEMWISSEDFIGKTAEILKNAKNFSYITTDNFPRHFELDISFLKAIKNDAKIKILGLSSLNDFNKPKAIWYFKNGADVRVLPLKIKPIFCVGDEKEMCIRIENGSDSEFIWSNNPALINIMKCYFESLWEKANKFKI